LSAIRERIGRDAHLIWGGAVDETVEDEVRLQLVAADVDYTPPVAAGDPCPRCGETVTSYTLGEKTTLACEGCGFADSSLEMEQLSYFRAGQHGVR